MKIQRKLLTDEQKKFICDTHMCDNCPLAYRIASGEVICWKLVEQMKKDFDKYWNNEIEVNL